MYVDDFKLAGPASELQAGWDLIRSASEVAPTGIDMDPPTAIGRYLGCEHRVSERWINWQGENPTVLDPPPPKPSKAAAPDDGPNAAVARVGNAFSAQTAPLLFDHTYPVPPGQAVWVRYDADAWRFRTSLPSCGPDWRTVVRRVTLDYNTWEELQDLRDLQHCIKDDLYA